ncbi:hypothetical protein C8Q70DRAFT_262641 [Cubamyces menziesii]|nr:hypothetical protein C8Q70DRAFT_262641 [Cubamyces menziesii]
MPGTELLHSSGIVSAICRHLSPGPLLPENEYRTSRSEALKERRKQQQALSRLARVCRTVSGSALDELWRSIDDFTHILYAFQDAYDRKKCMFIQALREPDKAKFNTYASRVRELYVGKIERVHATVWVVLVAHWGPRGPLLPGLERMTGFEINSNSLCYTMLFSPTLKHLSLQMDGRAEPGIMRMVVDAAKPVLSSLVNLSISSAVSSASPSAIPFWELRQLRQLHVAYPVALTRAIIRSLASFAHLDQLELKIADSVSPIELADEDRIQGFASLRTLTLKGSLAHTCAFMASAKPPALESLSIETSRVCTIGGVGTSGVERLLGTLPPSLRTFSATLSCELNHGYGGSCEPFPESKTLFAPLLSVKSLQRISIAVNNSGFRLTGATLANAEHAWPQLVQFKVTTPRPEFSGGGHEITVIRSTPPYRSVRAPPRLPNHPSVKTIAIFAHAHPKLEELILPTIDLGAVPELDSVPLLEHSLRHFSVCSLEGGVGLMYHARALDMLFPRLDLDHAYKLSATGKRQDEKDRNAELQLLLLALQVGRTSEPDRRQRTTREGSSSLDPHTIRLVGSKEIAEQPAAEEDDDLVRSDSEDEDLNYSRGRTSSWAVEAPPTYPSVPIPVPMHSFIGVTLPSRDRTGMSLPRAVIPPPQEPSRYP